MKEKLEWGKELPKLGGYMVSKTILNAMTFEPKSIRINNKSIILL